jgi:exodeoxyribonuclease V gamma subunit
MINLRYSNRMEALLDALAEAVREERAGPGAWKTIRVVVPNLATARRIEDHLVARLGLAANLEFLFLDKFLRSFLPEGTGLIDRPAIQGVLLRRFQRGDGLDGEVSAPVRRYLGAPPDPQRVAQLACRLGGLFEDYLYARPQWAPQWEQGRAALQDAGLEACERSLWSLVRRDLPAALLTPLEARARLRLPAQPGPVHLFAMTGLAFGYQALLDEVGRRAPGCLRFYTLNPCREFWDDLPTGPAREARRVQARRGLRDFTAELPEAADEDPYRLEDPDAAESGLLRLWGRAGREKIRLLNEMSDWDFEDDFQDPGRDTLLAALQQDILFRRAPDTPHPPDDSVQAHACPNPRREAETICELIWETLRARDAGQPPLRFSDFAVMVPAGALDTCATHLQAAGGGPDPIPWSPVHRESPALAEALEAFTLLLGLPGSPLSRAGVLGFLEHPAVRRHLAGTDLEPWPGWCRDTGIIRGRDRADLEPAYFEGDLLSWAQGHRRLALGAFLSQDGEPFEAGGERYPPQEIGSSAWPLAGAFLRTTRNLLEDLRSLPGETRSPRDWATRLADLAAAWIGGPERSDLAAAGKLRAALLRLGDLETAASGPCRHPFRTARELALQELGRLRGGRGGCRIQGVALGDPESLRGLPFRVVILAGMGEGAFPGADPADDLDLRQRRRLPGDVPASERDRYLFLEALLSARERFLVTYVSRHPVTGEELAASPVVDELLQAAAGMDADACRRTQPLLRWDSHRFTGPRPLLPAQTAVYLEAQAERRYRRGPIPPVQPPDPALEPLPRLPAAAPRPARLQVDLRSLEAFINSPLQGAARFNLGLRDEEDDPGTVEAEAAATASRYAKPMLREAFWAARGTGESLEQAYRRGRGALERAGQAALGLLGDRERRDGLKVLAAWADQVPIGVPVRFPRLGTSPMVKHGVRHEDWPLLEIPVRQGPDPVTVELAGTLPPQADLGSGPGSVLLLTGTGTPGKHPRDLVKAWLAHVVLAARGVEAADHRGYLVQGEIPEGGVAHLPFPALDPAAAQAILADLLGDLMGGGWETLLPLDAVADPAVTGAAELQEWLESRNSQKSYGTYACLYGPVPNPRAYPPADDAALARRRLLLRPFLQALGVLP